MLVEGAASPHERSRLAGVLVDALWLTGAAEAAASVAREVAGGDPPGVAAARAARDGVAAAEQVVSWARRGAHGVTAFERCFAIAALIACDELVAARAAIDRCTRVATACGGWVIARNLSRSGTALGPSLLPSTVGAGRNLMDALGALFGGYAGDDGPIDLLDLALGEQPAEPAQRFRMPPQHQAPRGIAVESVGQRRRPRQPEAQQWKPVLEVRAAARPGMHRDAGGRPGRRFVLNLYSSAPREGLRESSRNATIPSSCARRRGPALF